MFKYSLSVIIALVFVFNHVQAEQRREVRTPAPSYRLEVVRTGLDVPWGMDFLPDGRLIYTQKKGQLRILDLKTKSEVELKSLPPIKVVGQGGLMDVKVHPKFKQNNLVFISYAAEVDDEWTTHLARFELKNNQIQNFKVLFKALPANTNGEHFGSRIVIDDQDYLFLSVGDRGEREQAQDLTTHMGKIIRLHIDGRVPQDNPFAANPKFKPEIWSYGHRNPQGFDIHPITKELWVHEHGPRGGDEINLIKKGANYGWPEVTFGREYWGPSIGVKQKQGTEAPVHQWTPSIAPSGLKIYNGEKFSDLKGSFLSGALAYTHLNRVQLDANNKFVREDRFFKDEKHRVRSLAVSAEGDIYFSADSGKIFKLIP